MYSTSAWLHVMYWILPPQIHINVEAKGEIKVFFSESLNSYFHFFVFGLFLCQNIIFSTLVDHKNTELFHCLLFFSGKPNKFAL